MLTTTKVAAVGACLDRRSLPKSDSTMTKPTGATTYWCDNSARHPLFFSLRVNACHEAPWQKEDSYFSSDYIILGATEDGKARCRITVYEGPGRVGGNFPPMEPGEGNLVECHDTWDNPTMCSNSVSVECSDDDGDFEWNNHRLMQSEEC